MYSSSLFHSNVIVEHFKILKEIEKHGNCVTQMHQAITTVWIYLVII